MGRRQASDRQGHEEHPRSRRSQDFGVPGPGGRGGRAACKCLARALAANSSWSPRAKVLVQLSVWSWQLFPRTPGPLTLVCAGLCLLYRTALLRPELSIFMAGAKEGADA